MQGKVPALMSFFSEKNVCFFEKTENQDIIPPGYHKAGKRSGVFFPDVTDGESESK